MLSPLSTAAPSGSLVERMQETVLHSLAILAALLTAADHWTTYLCLRRPVPGWDAVEANPVVAWLFELTGLVPGLMIDSGITALAIAFILVTPMMSRVSRYLCLGVMTGAGGYAVANNLEALSTLGLSPLGIG